MVLNFKKVLLSGMALAVVATSSIGLTACGKTNTNDNVDAQDFYAMSVISSVNYFQNISGESQSTPLLFANDAQTSTAPESRPETISQDDVNNIAGYMGMFQDMLTSNTTSYYTNGAVDQDDDYYGEYNLKMTLTVPMLGGGEEEFVMYYKEVNTETEEEIDDNEIELEINTTLQGVIVNGDNVYDVSGKREYEKEGNETEISIELTTYSRANSQDYIKIEHEQENNEMEYNYSIYSNGHLINETEVEFENERNEKSLELEFVNNSVDAQNKVKYEITQSRTDENIFNVRVKNASNNSEVRDTFTIKIVDGYEFTYSNGYTETIK